MWICRLKNESWDALKIEMFSCEIMAIGTFAISADLR